MKRIVLLLLACALSGAISARAAFDCFLKLEGVPGESTHVDHRDEIVIESFSMGIAGAPGSAGGPQFSDLSLTKYLDKASPLLMLKCAQGAPIPMAVLTCKSAGGDKPVNFYVIRLKNVFVTSVSAGGAAGGDRPTESFSLNFSEIEWEYVPILPTGAPGTPVRTSWDLKKPPAE